MLNNDYKNILLALSNRKAKFLLLSISDLIKNKRSTGRNKDLVDAESLEDLLKRGGME
jgi:hypothetical protein